MSEKTMRVLRLSYWFYINDDQEQITVEYDEWLKNSIPSDDFGDECLVAVMRDRIVATIPVREMESEKETILRAADKIRYFAMDIVVGVDNAVFNLTM